MISTCSTNSCPPTKSRTYGKSRRQTIRDQARIWQISYWKRLLHMKLPKQTVRSYKEEVYLKTQSNYLRKW